MKSADTMRTVANRMAYDEENVKKAESIFNEKIEKAANAGDTETLVDLNDFDATVTLEPLEILRGYGYKYEFVEDNVIEIRW